MWLTNIAMLHGPGMDEFAVLLPRSGESLLSLRAPVAGEHRVTTCSRSRCHPWAQRSSQTKIDRVMLVSFPFKRGQVRLSLVLNIPLTY